MNLRTVRKKIKSVRNVRKITKAMQMVSAIKMRKAQQSEIDGRPYRNGLVSLMEKVYPKVNPDYSPILSSHHDGDRQLVVLVTSNKGLAGSFNVGLFRYLIRSEMDFSKCDFITIGLKGAQFAGRMGGKVIADFSRGAPLVQVPTVFSFVIETYLKQSAYQKVILVFNQFISTLRANPTIEILLPINDFSKKVSEGVKQTPAEYLIEPSPEQIVDDLLRSYIEERIRGAVISSEAVEHSMRMMAMKNATDNAEDVIYNLTLVGNKLRQEKITSELLDMVTAKESVESN